MVITEYIDYALKGADYESKIDTKKFGRRS